MIFLIFSPQIRNIQFWLILKKSKIIFGNFIMFLKIKTQAEK